MGILQDLQAYFTKNGGLNTVTGALIPAALQVVTTVDPTLASTITGAFSPDVSTLLLSGGTGTIAALFLVVLRVGLALTRKTAS